MTRLLSFFFISSIIVITWGCDAENPADEKQMKKEKLEEYNSQMNELKKKIADLEAEIGSDIPQNKVNVEVSELKPTLYEQFIEAIGNVSTDQNIIVSPETGGIIESIPISEGDEVNKGQILARLKTESLRKSIEEAKINLELASNLYNRRKNLWEQNIGSEVEYLQAKANMNSLEKKIDNLQAQMDMSVIKAPIDGVVDDLMQNQGEMAGPAIPFVRLVNLETVYITTNVSEKYLNSINPGDSVTVYFPIPDVEKKGTIFRKSAVIDPDSRTFGIRVNLKNKENTLRPNLMGEMKMRISKIPDALVVPSLLVKKDFKGEFIFVATKNQNNIQVTEKKYITTSIRDNNQTVVSDGLEPGDQIITSGFAQVTEGTPLNIQ
ncbi:MAG: efflux RND transporter periplasmic adaptor subunit [Bacteroidota bacterium]